MKKSKIALQLYLKEDCSKMKINQKTRKTFGDNYVR